MTIQDNGKGFYTDENRFGTGLMNMKKRADTLKGNLVISSTPDICTQIKIEIPLNEYKHLL
jgi:signal transduction histidine kinase